MNIHQKKIKAGPKRKQPSNTDEMWILRLYVAGQIPKAVIAFNNLKVICEDQLKGRYHIEVVDLSRHPQLAHDDKILALPTLVRKSPLPERNIIGDLSNTELVLIGLDLIAP